MNHKIVLLMRDIASCKVDVHSFHLDERYDGIDQDSEMLRITHEGHTYEAEHLTRQDFWDGINTAVEQEIEMIKHYHEGLESEKLTQHFAARTDWRVNYDITVSFLDYQRQQIKQDKAASVKKAPQPKA